MSAQRPTFRLSFGHVGRRRIGFAVMIALAGLWLAAASRLHVNASWSDSAWGYAAFPLFGGDPKIGDRVLFEPRPDRGEPAPAPGSSPGQALEPGGQASTVPYLKTVRGVPGMVVTVGKDGTVFLDGEPVGRAKTHALDRRPLAPIAPGIIPAGYFYLHADHIDSHDSRYAEIGLVPRGRILGRAIAMPDVPWLGLKGPLVGPEDNDRAAGPPTILPHPTDKPPPAEAGHIGGGAATGGRP